MFEPSTEHKSLNSPLQATENNMESKYDHRGEEIRIYEAKMNDVDAF
jgi:hypothetical protein